MNVRRILLYAALGLIPAACTNPDGAREVLLDAGYTQVQTDGYDAWACSDDDTYATRFRAIGPTGRPTQGVVCEGLFLKDATIRLRRR